MKRQLRTLEEYKNSLGDLHDRMVLSIQNSVDDWRKIQDFSNGLGIGAVNYKPRTKAAVVHDHIAHRIFNEFYHDDNIKIDEFNGVFGFLFEDKFFIRFKKMDPKKFTTSNVSTKQNTKYSYQYPTISGLPESPTILYAGYSLDKTGDNILGIYLVCRDGDNIEWVDEYGVYDSQQVSFDFNDLKVNETKVDKLLQRVRAKNIGRKKSTGTDL